MSQPVAEPQGPAHGAGPQGADAPVLDQAALDASLGRPTGVNHAGAGAANLTSFPPPLGIPDLGARRSPAEEARTVVATTRLASLATLSEAGDPWSSLVGYGVLPDGSLSLVLSGLAEHGRNLAMDPRASLSVAAPVSDGHDPLDASRITLVGRVRVPEGPDAALALEAHCEAYPAARAYARFGDFTLYVLEIERVRWVGGFGRMDNATAEDYRRAEVDPTAGAADDAVAHLNADHADALLLIAQEVAAYHDAISARCERIDRYGMDLKIRTLRGSAPARVGFATRADGPEGLRAGSVELTRRSRAKREASLHA